MSILSKPKPLRVYFGGSVSPNEFPYVAACFAENAEQAKKLMWMASGALCEDCGDDYTRVRVKWQRCHNDLAGKVGATAPRLITDDETLRDLGWSLVGDDRCEHCEKATFDGDYPLCESCCRCGDCGHADDCHTGVKE